MVEKEEKEKEEEMGGKGWAVRNKSAGTCHVMKVERRKCGELCKI